MLAATIAVAATIVCIAMAIDTARHRQWADGGLWLLAAVVLAAFAVGLAWLDHETRVSDCRVALATENAQRGTDRLPALPDTCGTDPDQFERNR